MNVSTSAGHLVNTGASGGPYQLAQGLQLDATSSILLNTVGERNELAQQASAAARELDRLRQGLDAAHGIDIVLRI